MSKTIEQLASDFANSWERINAIVEDMATVEPTTDLSSAAIHGFLRELSDQTISAICLVQQIQRIGRRDGYPGDFDKESEA